DGHRGGGFGGDFRAGRADHRALAGVLAGRAGRFVVFVAREAGRPVVGAGGFGFEFPGVVFAVGFDFFDDRARDFGFAFFIGELLEGYFAFAGRFHQAGVRVGVFLPSADGHRGGGFGGDFRFGRSDHRALAGVLAGRAGRFVVFVAREAGR